MQVLRYLRRCRAEGGKQVSQVSSKYKTEEKRSRKPHDERAADCDELSFSVRKKVFISRNSLKKINIKGEKL